MSNNTESDKKPQLFLSIASESFEDSALLSGVDLFTYSNSSQMGYQKIIQELKLEIELINEDRSRLKLENERLKSTLKEMQTKNIEIDLLQQIASKALSENYNYRKKLNEINSPLQRSPHKIHIRSPSEVSFQKQFPLQEYNNVSISSNRLSEVTSANTSPLKSTRNSSARIKVTRNNLKYQKLATKQKIKKIDTNFKKMLLDSLI